MDHDPSRLVGLHTASIVTHAVLMCLVIAVFSSASEPLSSSLFTPSTGTLFVVPSYAFFLTGLIIAAVASTYACFSRAYLTDVYNCHSSHTKTLMMCTVACGAYSTALSLASHSVDLSILLLMFSSVSSSVVFVVLSDRDPRSWLVHSRAPLIRGGILAVGPALFLLGRLGPDDRWWLYGCVIIAISSLPMCAVNQAMYVYQVFAWDSYATTEFAHVSMCIACNIAFTVFLVASSFG